MNEVLKQRLVGALILVALALIFWPIVFVEPDQKPGAQSQSIPEPPLVSTEAIQEAEDTGSPELAEYGDSQVSVDADSQGSAGAEATGDVIAESGTPVDAVEAAPESAQNAAHGPAAVTVAAAVSSESPQPPTMAADGNPVAWMLQVATVSSAEKADALRRRLLEKGEKAYVTMVSSGGKQLYRVSVGPTFERHELERIQESINAEFGVKTMLVRHLP